MTNREAFNTFIRMSVEKQLRYMEAMSDEELVQYTIDHPGYHIETDIGDKLCYFKAMTGGVPVGDKSIVTEWLKDEAKDDIQWEKML